MRLGYVSITAPLYNQQDSYNGKQSLSALYRGLTKVKSILPRMKGKPMLQFHIRRSCPNCTDDVRPWEDNIKCRTCEGEGELEEWLDWYEVEDLKLQMMKQGG